MKRSFILIFVLIATGCSITQSAVVKDSVTQNGVMQPSSIPHLQGPPLKANQTRLQGRYGYTGSPDALQNASDKTLGHLTPKHLLYGQMVFPIGEGSSEGSSESKVGVWEIGIFGGGALSLEDAQRSNEDQDANLFKDTSLPFLKFGVGLRGPLVQKNKFTLGLNLEGEVSRQAFKTNIDRVQTIMTTFEWDEQLRQDFNLDDGESTITTQSEMIEHEDYFFSLTPRAALYGQYQVLDFLSLDFGFSAQYIQYQKSILSNECTYEKELTNVSQLTDPEALILDDDCSPESLYPVNQYHFDFTYYGGATFRHQVVHLSMLFAYSHAPFDDFSPASPFTFTTQAGITF